MKKLLKVLGKILMFTALIFSITTLICSVPMKRDTHMSLLETIMIVLCMLLMFFGLFCLGWLLYKAGCREKKDRKTKRPGLQKAASPQTRAVQAPAKTPPAAQGASGAGVARPSSHGANPSRCSPLPEDPRMLLYQSFSAREDASLRDGSAVPESLWLFLREGTPRLQLSAVQLGELFSGSMYHEEQQEKEVPVRLRGDLDSQRLQDWIEKSFPCMRELNWKTHLDQDRLNDFCNLIRRQAAQLPSSVYFTFPPFPVLNDIAADELRDDSGIKSWLKPRKDALRDEALAETEQIARDGKTVLLTEDIGFLSLLPRERLDALEKAGVMVGALRKEETLTDLLTKKEYHLRYDEWAGSADDAATFARWWLETESEQP